MLKISCQPFKIILRHIRLFNKQIPMKKIFVFIILAVFTTSLNAQNWDIHIETGASFGRLIPVLQSTPRTANLRYGFSKPGLYLSPEIRFTVSAHSQFSIGYQFSDNKAGIKFLTPSRSAKETEYDIIDLHNFSVGYYFQQVIFHEHIRIGGFVKIGLAYGYMDGFGGSGNGGSFSGGYQGVAFAGSQRLTAFEVMPDFWTPDNTIGFSIGKNATGNKLANRLTLDISATICWKNPYKDYSKVYYFIGDNQLVKDGIAQYQGIPLLMQIGVSYRLFRLGNGSSNHHSALLYHGSGKS